MQVNFIDVTVYVKTGNSVATFVVKNRFKLIHNDMRSVSVRKYSKNYFKQLTMASWYTNLTDLYKYR